MWFQSWSVFTCFCIASISANENNNVSNTTSQLYDTIVVGLGSSGVTAASTLVRAGKRVLGLEAQGRIGGRVWTMPLADGVVELGAEWIHGERPSRVYDLAVQNNISIIPDETTLLVYNPEGNLEDVELFTDLMLYCLDLMDVNSEQPEPLGNFITRRFMDYLKQKHPGILNDKKYLDEFLEIINLMVNSYEGSNDWNDVNTYSTFEPLEGCQYLSWHRYGYKTFFDILLNKYNNDSGLPNLDIKLNTEVTKITWPQDPAGPVVVTSADGASYTADHVIVTVSLGVLKERHSSLFSPQLPQEKVTAIENIPLGVVDKIVLLFSEPWWPKNISFFAFFWNEEGRRKVAKEDYWTTKIYGASRPMGSSYTLALWATGEIAKLIEILPEDVVKRKSMDLLRKFMGQNITIPEPTRLIRSSWYSNPYTRGSYSYDSHSVVEHPDARVALARPLLDRSGRPRVLFAGEASHETHYSTVHGASETGYRESMRLLSQN